MKEAYEYGRKLSEVEGETLVEERLLEEKDNQESPVLV